MRKRSPKHRSRLSQRSRQPARCTLRTLAEGEPFMRQGEEGTSVTNFSGRPYVPPASDGRRGRQPRHQRSRVRSALEATPQLLAETQSAGVVANVLSYSAAISACD